MSNVHTARGFTRVALWITITMGVIIPTGLPCALSQTDQSLQAKRGLLAAHQKAVHLMDDWMRDPFIELAPDGYYYLSCTRQNSSFPNELPAMQFYRSKEKGFKRHGLHHQ